MTLVHLSMIQNTCITLKGCVGVPVIVSLNYSKYVQVTAVVVFKR